MNYGYITALSDNGEPNADSEETPGKNKSLGAYAWTAEGSGLSQGP